MGKKRGNLKKSDLLTILGIIIVSILLVYLSKEQSNYKLEIISAYGDNEAFHPKVIAFKEKWNGYKYWMSYTPYPKGNSRKENPHIAVSNDLINWKTPKGLINPLDETDGIPRKRYNSDAHIVYNDDTNTLSIYWRLVDFDKVIIYRRDTTDGINWTPKKEVIVIENRHQKDYISPAIIYEDHMYKMWYVDVKNRLTYASSADGDNWIDSERIFLEYPTGLKTWHLDVIKTEKGYEMLVVAYDKWKNYNDMNLYYTKSNDGIVWDKVKVVLKPETKTRNWDNKGIYRSSFIYEDGKYYLYYGATSKTYRRGIGFAYGKDIFNLKTGHINFKKKKETKDFIDEIKPKKQQNFS